MLSETILGAGGLLSGSYGKGSAGSYREGTVSSYTEGDEGSYGEGSLGCYGDRSHDNSYVGEGRKAREDETATTLTEAPCAAGPGRGLSPPRRGDGRKGTARPAGRLAGRPLPLQSN